MNLNPKDPADVVPVLFDYSLLGSPVASAVVTAKTSSGTDASATLANPKTIDGSVVKQMMGAGTDGIDYVLRCVATLADGQVSTLVAVIPVRITTA